MSKLKANYKKNEAKTNVALIGASGFTGLETLKIILKHPKILIKALIGDKSKGKDINSIFSSMNHLDLPRITALEDVDLSSIDVIFSCMPSGILSKNVNNLPTNRLIIDLSADFRLDNLKELVNAINEFESLQNFLEHIQLVMEGANNQNLETAKIMTLHAAKGLEFPLVFLPGWEEGLFPNQRSVDESGESGLEEERRLAYVGITRAKNNVWIFNANSRLTHGQWIDCIPSRFIDELPDKNINRFSTYSNNFKSSIASEWLIANNKKGINLSKDYIDENNDNKFKLMERIFHQKFGYGKILEIDGDKVTIDFEKAGEKKLMLTFIEKI